MIPEPRGSGLTARLPASDPSRERSRPGSAAAFVLGRSGEAHLLELLRQRGEGAVALADRLAALTSEWGSEGLVTFGIQSNDIVDYYDYDVQI